MSSRQTHKRRADPQFEEYRLTDLLGETASFTAQSISDDGRRTYQTTHSFDLPSPLKKARRQKPPPSLFAEVGDGFEYVFDDLAVPTSSVKTAPGVKGRAKRYLSSVRDYFFFSVSSYANTARIAQYQRGSRW
jgi:hypothetical protein